MKYKVINAEKLPERYKIKKGDIGDLIEQDKQHDGFLLKNENWYLDGEWWFHKDWISPFFGNVNREFLRDFISLNNIKTTLVSKQLGKSKGWLTQVMNRTDRGDLSDNELQDILKKLHIDWTQDTFVYVKATPTNAAYRTRPCVYEHAKHKELLQRAFWDGCFTQ